jgi:hypothetical protein
MGWLAEVRSRLKIPEGAYVICLVALGVPAESPTQASKKDLMEIVFSEEYGKPLTR